MKVKEKLAEEYSEDFRGEGHYEAIQEAHIAGFERARAMAVVESTRYSSEGWRLDGLPYRLAGLGEEEAK